MQPLSPKNIIKKLIRCDSLYIMIRLIIILILPLLVQSQESEFYLEESLDNHISRSIEEEMDVSSNQIQVIYAKYSAEKDNFNFSYFGSAKYFYPASIVKFPILLLALEWLNELEAMKQRSHHSKRSFQAPKLHQVMDSFLLPQTRPKQSS